mgnify:CR=1 FL=1
MLSETVDFIDVFKKLGIKKKDNISVCSSILRILSLNKKKKFKPQIIIDALKRIVTKEGLLMIDAFCWDFCKTSKFDYFKTVNQIGSLAKVALNDKEFVRTKNPIYSFITFGKKNKYVSKINHYSCFSKDSPFGYIIKNHGKYLLIDLDFRAHAYVHLAEQEVGMEHRYFKTFKGTYIDKNKVKSNVATEMYCRRFDNIETYINPTFKSFLKKNKALKQTKKNGVNFVLIDANKAHKLKVQDLKCKKKYIYPKKVK